jgi:lipoprotein-anchoring transpeptidase ErfK/SrfK
MAGKQHEIISNRRPARRRRPGALAKVAVLSVATVLVLASACSGDEPSGGGGGEEAPRSKATATVVSPKADATDVPTSAVVEFAAENAKSVTVELADEAGKAVSGEPGAKGTTWLPDRQLAYGTTYKATVTATDDEGRTTTATSTFTTMPEPPNQVRVSSVVGDDMVVGVGMPMIVQFGREIPEDLRASVQERLTVRSEPPQAGAWHWFAGNEVHYRPREYWKPGTKLDMSVRTGGLPMGGDWYGRSDLTVVAEVGPSLVMTVDNATKRMTVVENGRPIRTIPVSLGRPGMPSSSGTMVIMERLVKTVFDTRNDPNPDNRYRLNISYAQRVTWGGEFLHAAPWSVAAQGRRNVSHGCINMSTENAKWLFGKTKIGDPVVVKGTGERLKYGNGWTDWSMSWEEYVKGSAIPVDAEAVPSPSATD